MSLPLKAKFDLRLHALRPDLADAALQGKVEALLFVEGHLKRVICPVASLREKPSFDAQQMSEVLYGEEVKVFEEKEGWAWVQSCCDGYVGYTTLESLSTIKKEQEVHETFDVRVLSSLVFPKPDLKMKPVMTLPMGAKLSVIGEDESTKYRQIESGWIWGAHLRGCEQKDQDYMTRAESLIETPYLWGGGTVWGIDCSGLVQLVFAMAGLRLPRDADQQEVSNVGFLRNLDKDVPLKRGDILFWQGHVALYRGGNSIVHANATHMNVSFDSFERVCEKIGSPRCVRRIKEDVLERHL